MNITVAQHADAHDMLEMLAEYQESLDTARVIDEDKNERFIQALIQGEHRATLFIGRTSSSGQAAAFAIVCLQLRTPEAELVPFMTNLFVRPAYRRKGFGRQFFEYLLRWARKQNYSRLCWQVENLNLTGQYMFDPYNPEIVGWVGYSLDLTKD